MERLGGDRTPRLDKPLRIGVISPPMLPIPPARYAGTERIVAALVDGLHRRGHRVTLFAPGDSQVECELVPTVPHSLWSTGYRGDLTSYLNLTLAKVWAASGDFDVIHSHVETIGLPFARWCPTPVVSTFHGRLDVMGHPALLDEFCDVPLIAISESQRRWSPRANWVATIPHGLDLTGAPFRRRAGDLSRASSVGSRRRRASQMPSPWRGRPDFGCASPPRSTTSASTSCSPRSSPRPSRRASSNSWARSGGAQRDELFAGALATVMLGAWPEPFGLVAIESMATGTPVIARRAGALPEIVEHGRSGFLVDDLQEAILAVGRAGSLDRRQVRRAGAGALFR